MKYKLKQCVIFIFIFTIIQILVTFLFSYVRLNYHERLSLQRKYLNNFFLPYETSKNNDQSTKKVNVRKRDTSTKLINVFGYFGDYLPKTVPNCSYRCKITQDKNLINKVDAVVFYGWNLPTPLPKYRNPRQRWVFLLNETPRTSLSIIENFSLKKYNGLFNWTMTYLKSSDIRIRSWKFVKKDKQKKYVNYAKNKTKLAFAVVNDSEFKERLKLIKELKHMIPIDFYGKYGDIKCPNKTCEFNAKKYKFYLAFENSFYCKDYIRETFYSQGLLNDVVPVAKGPIKTDYLTNVENFPKNSFIHVDDFKDAKALSNYLIYLNKNDNAYNAFHKWKRDYRLEKNRNKWCSLCEKLYTDDKPKIYNNLVEWFNTCENFKIL